jgi:hypothetical protein
MDILSALRALLPTLDPMIADANHYRADQDGRGGGRVADAYNDAANSGLSYTMPTSTDPSRTYSPGAWRDYLLDQMKRNRTSNPFAASEADLSAGYPASGLSNDQRFANAPQAPASQADLASQSMQLGQQPQQQAPQGLLPAAPAANTADKSLQYLRGFLDPAAWRALTND